jgi:hypothetical protein
MMRPCARARLAAATLVSALAVLAPSSAASAQTASQSFSGAGEHEFVVPAGVTSLQVTLIGGNGGGGRFPGGAGGAPGQGATVMATVAVTPGETLYAEVAGNGESGSPEGGGKGGAGGGASDLRTCALACGGASSPTRLVVAAGGGGGGGEGGPAGVTGGPGGSADRSGTTGSIYLTLQAGEGGKRGTTSGGGAGGARSYECPALATCSKPGVEASGGSGGGGSAGGGGGGGGGGIFGGGGGGGGEGFETKPGEWENAGGGGGGGGSSGVPAAGAGRVSGFLQLLTALGAEPSISISWTVPAPAPTAASPSPANTLSAGPAATPGPSVTDLTLSPARFRRGSHAATIARAQAPTGTTIAFVLTHGATATLSFEQPQTGVRAGARCVPVGRSAHRGRPCTRWVTLAHRIVRQAHAGTDRVHFEGVVDGGNRLTPGSYRLSLSASNAGGSASAPQRPGFTLLP